MSKSHVERQTPVFDYDEYTRFVPTAVNSNTTAALGAYFE